MLCNHCLVAVLFQHHAALLNKHGIHICLTVREVLLCMFTEFCAHAAIAHISQLIFGIIAKDMNTYLVGKAFVGEKRLLR